MRSGLKPAIFCLAFFLCTPAFSGVYFDFALGGAYTRPSELTINQLGEESIYIENARFETQPLTNPVYYAWRLGFTPLGQVWEVELVHHKLYLINKHPDIDQFSVSHGFNLLGLNRVWPGSVLDWRLGMGLVLAHPESEIRGQVYDENHGILDHGFHWVGTNIQAAVGRRFPLRYRNLYAFTEGKLTWASVKLPVSNGEAVMDVVAGHVLFGLGYHLR